jgi:hypothetical protein
MEGEWVGVTKVKVKGGEAKGEVQEEEARERAGGRCTREARLLKAYFK